MKQSYYIKIIFIYLLYVLWIMIKLWFDENFYDEKFTSVCSKLALRFRLLSNQISVLKMNLRLKW